MPVAISQPDRPNSDFGLSFVIVAFAESSRTLIHMHPTDFGPIRSQPRVWQRWALVPAPKYCTKTVSCKKRRRGTSSLGVDRGDTGQLLASARDYAESGGVGKNCRASEMVLAQASLALFVVHATGGDGAAPFTSSRIPHTFSIFSVFLSSFAGSSIFFLILACSLA